MIPDARLLLFALLAVAALVVLIARFKLHPFIALVSVSLAMGVIAGMAPAAAVKAFQEGVGNTLGFIAIVVGLGTMLGKMMAESGAATRIATTLIELFGERRVHWAIMFVAFIVGIPVFFQVGFVLLIPLVFTIARRTGLSLVKIGIPLVAGLGGSRNVAAPPRGDARRNGVQRRCRPHNPLWPARRSPNRFAGRAHLRDVDRAAHNAAGGESAGETIRR